MRTAAVIAAFAGFLSLSACNEDKVACTPEEAEKKSIAMVTRMQELATTNPERMAEVAEKALEIQMQLADSAGDRAKACEAIDELMKAMD